MSVEKVNKYKEEKANRKELLEKQKKQAKAVRAGVIAGAALKCGFLWLTAPLVLSIAGLPEKQAAMLSIMFSWPQFVTALCGGLLAWSVLPRVRRRQRGNI